MATAKKQAAGPATKGLRIVSRSEQGFRRCGRHFGPDGTTVPLSELTEAEVSVLQGERQLIVVEVDIGTDDEAKKA